MTEQEKKPSGADGKKKKFYSGQFARGAMTSRSTYKSKVQGLESDTLDVGASSNPSLQSCDAHKHQKGEDPIKDTLQHRVYLQRA